MPAATVLRQHPRTALVLAALLLAGVVARWVGLADESLWFDEGMTAWLSSLSPGRMIQVIRGDVAAPLHFLLLMAWRALFGDSVTALRGFSALAATLAILPAGWIAARSLRGRGAFVAAAAMLAASHMQILYAREARYYALVSLLGGLALCGAWLAVSGRRLPGVAIAVLASSAGLYTHSMMLFAIAGTALAWLILPGERRLPGRAGDLLLAGACVAILYAPWVPTLLRQMRWMSGTFWADPPKLWDLQQCLSAVSGADPYLHAPGVWAIFGNSPLTTQGAAHAVVACVLILVSLGILAADSRDRRTAWALAAFALAPVAAVFVLSHVRQPVFMPRVFAPSSLVMPVLLAMPLIRGRRPDVRAVAAVAVGAVVLLSTLSFVGLHTGRWKEDWRGAYAAVATLPPSDSRLVLFVANEGELPFAYYADHDPSGRPQEQRSGAPAGFFDLEPPQTIRRVLRDADLDGVRRQLDSGRWDQVVLVESHQWFSDPDARTRRLLDASGRLVWTRPLSLVDVSVYDLPDRGGQQP